MAKKLTVVDNYVIYEDTVSGQKGEYAMNKCVYREDADRFTIKEIIDNASLTILKSEIIAGDWTDGATPYNEATLRTFLQSNTGFNPASGGSGAVDGHVIYDAPSTTPVTQREKLVFDGNGVTVSDANDLSYGNYTKVTINAPALPYKLYSAYVVDNGSGNAPTITEWYNTFSAITGAASLTNGEIILENGAGEFLGKTSVLVEIRAEGINPLNNWTTTAERTDNRTIIIRAFDDNGVQQQFSRFNIEIKEYV